MCGPSFGFSQSDQIESIISKITLYILIEKKAFFAPDFANLSIVHPCHVTNLGLLGEKPEHRLCVMMPPPPVLEDEQPISTKKWRESSSLKCVHLFQHKRLSQDNSMRYCSTGLGFSLYRSNLGCLWWFLTLDKGRDNRSTKFSPKLLSHCWGTLKLFWDNLLNREVSVAQVLTWRIAHYK